MVLLTPWVLFFLFPLFLLYKRSSQEQSTRQLRLLYLTLFFLFVALSRPAIKHAQTDEKFPAQEYIIAIDASYSMQATDLKPSRFIMAKEAIAILLNAHPKDRFTLFAFTSNALLISPPTTDSSISLQALNALNPNYILTKSTSLKHLFTSIAKLSFEKKNLIIFSDGGDEHDLQLLLKQLKEANITPYIVATASSKGAALKKDTKFLQDSKGALVISKINPILKDLATLAGGEYYELTSKDSITTLLSDISESNAKQETKVSVQSYKELFIWPLLLGVMLFFIAITKLHQLYLFIIFIFFIPNKADASLLDFYHLNKAQTAYEKKSYLVSAKNFKAIPASVNSYYNIGVSYYKAGAYKKSLQFFSQIQTPNRALKQKIYYNMGNAAFKLQKYTKAATFYGYALALGSDSDAKYNLDLLHKLHLHESNNVAKMLPQAKQSAPDTKKKNEGQKKQKKSQTKKKSGGSNRSSDQSSSGAGKSKKKEQKGSLIKKKQSQNNNYIMGYKAYEIINKGYSDEKEPW